MAPTVTVAMPVYNGMPYVVEAVGSILAQTFDELELIVVDNSSDDGTVAALRDIDDSRLQISTNEEHVEAVDNWNRTLGSISGRYFKLVCADDVLFPNCLSRQVSVLEDPSNQEVVMVTCSRNVIDPRGRVLVSDWGVGDLHGTRSPREVLRSCVRAGTNLIGEPAAVLMRTEIVRETGGWNDAVPYLTDLDYWMRLMDRGKLYGLQETLCKFRVHPGAWSTDIGRSQARQFTQFAHQLRSRHPEWISRSDLAIGVAKAHALGAARTFLYWAMRKGIIPWGRGTR